MSERKPPERTPPKFVVGSKVWVRAHKAPILGTITSIRVMDEEWLVRTAYAAGFYSYEVETDDFKNALHVSENVLSHATIETLGGLAE